MKNQTMRYAFYALLLLALGAAGWANPPVVGNAAKGGISIHPKGFSEQTTMILSVDPQVVPWTGQQYTTGSLTVTLSGGVAQAGDVDVYAPSGDVIKTIHFPVIDEFTHDPSYAYTIDNVVYPAAAGTHVFTAKSGRVNGTKLEASASVRVNIPPIVTITAPTDNGVIAADVTFNLSAVLANPLDSPVRDIEFWLDEEGTRFAVGVENPATHVWSTTVEASTLAIGTHTIYAKVYDFNGNPSNTTGVSFTIRPVITVTTNYPNMCAGNLDDSLHQVVVTVSAKTAAGLPVPGYTVNIAVTYGDNMLAPKYASYGTGYVPTFKDENNIPQPGASGVTGTNGEFQCTMQAGKLEFTTASYGVVNIKVTENAKKDEKASVTIGAPAISLNLRDDNDEEVEWFYYGDVLTINGGLSYNTDPDQGQPVTWSFKYWSDNKNPNTDAPTYIFDPNNHDNDDLYGYMVYSQSETDEYGQCSTEYVGGYAIGYYKWYMKVDDVYTDAP